MTRKLLVSLVVVGGLCLVARSGPVLPRQGSELPDEIRTTAGIRSVRLVVGPLPATIRATGLSAKWIQEDWTQRIEQAGIRVVEEPEAPALTLQLLDFNSDSVPDAKGYCIILSLKQKVRIDRFTDESFSIPTWTGVNAGMDTGKALSGGVHTALKLALYRFLDRSLTATVVSPKKKSEGRANDRD